MILLRLLVALLTIPLGLDLYLPVPEDNPITVKKVALGRQLFFETPARRIMFAEIGVKGASLNPGKPRLWMERQLLDTTVIRNYAVMPDGKHLLILPRPEEPEKKTTPHVTFLLNFFDELKRRLP